MRCWLQWCASRKLNSNRRSTVSLTAGLLFRQGVPPHATYLFKHALVQDAAYGTLLREPRRALHARIAETLESQFADIAERQPEILARHLTEAGWAERAVEQWLKAGRRAAGRSAHVEAITHLTRGLDLLVSLPEWPRRGVFEATCNLRWEYHSSRPKACLPLRRPGPTSEREPFAKQAATLCALLVRYGAYGIQITTATGWSRLVPCATNC